MVEVYKMHSKSLGHMGEVCKYNANPTGRCRRSVQNTQQIPGGGMGVQSKSLGEAWEKYTRYTATPMWEVWEKH